MRKRLLTSILGLALIVGMVSVAQANLITNPSFELGTNPGSLLTLSAGATDITDWDIGSGGVDYIGTFWVASDGSRSLDMNAVTPGSISQSIPTVAGVRYEVLFDMAGNPDSGPTIKDLQVSADVTSADYSFDITNTARANMGWVTQSFVFTAADTSTLLSFTSLTTGPSGNTTLAFGPALDNIRATVVPEPSTLILLGSGLTGLGFFRRRRKVV